MFDIEDLITAVEKLLRQNLNARINAIEAEKAGQGKAIGLPVVRQESYFEQTFSNEIMNSAPAIFYGLADNVPDGLGPTTAQVVQIFIEIVTVDSGQDAFGIKRVHRYSRAIREVLQDNYDQISQAGRIKVKTVEPRSFKLSEDSSDNIKVGGVLITAAIV